MAEGLEATVLNAIDSEGEIPDTGDFAKQHGVDHKALTGVALSLESIGFILKQVHGYKWVCRHGCGTLEVIRTQQAQISWTYPRLEVMRNHMHRLAGLTLHLKCCAVTSTDKLDLPYT